MRQNVSFAGQKKGKRLFERVEGKNDPVFSGTSATFHRLLAMREAATTICAFYALLRVVCACRL